MERNRRFQHRNPQNSSFRPSSSSTSSCESTRSRSNKMSSSDPPRPANSTPNSKGRAYTPQEREDGNDSSNHLAIVGNCPFMCPEGERSQRERLRDLAPFERLNGNPSLSSPSLAVKKFSFRNCQERSGGSQIRVGAMATNERNMKIEKFDGVDFGFWKMQIEDYLYQKNLHQPLSGKKPEAMKEEDWNLLDRQALGVIRMMLSRNVVFNIAKEKTTASLMAALSSIYEKPSASNKVHLMRRLFNLQMAEGASVAQHLNELNTITTQLGSVEIEFDDEVRALILLSSLPDSWNTTVTAFSNSSGINKLKFDDVRDLVLSEEIQRRESGKASNSSALHTESRGRTSKRNSNRSRSKSRRGKSRSGKKDFNCYNCGKKGHFKKDCRAPKKDTGVQESANVTEEAGDVMILSFNSSIESWILDSGASFHATPC